MLNIKGLKSESLLKHFKRRILLYLVLYCIVYEPKSCYICRMICGVTIYVNTAFNLHWLIYRNSCYRDVRPRSIHNLPPGRHSDLKTG